jgi:hypothetical protein
MKLKIENNIAIPNVGGVGRPRSPLFKTVSAMKKGQSVFVGKCNKDSVRVNVCRWGHELGFQFATRIVKEGRLAGIRIWRVA